MRTRLHYFAIAAIACAMVSGGSAVAQMVPCVTGGMVGGERLGVNGGIKNAPYSAVMKSSFEQKLGDGNAIHTMTQSHQARDSAGRTMTEMKQGCVLGEDGQMHERSNVSVNDPVARTNMNWQVGDDQLPKVVRVYHQPQPNAPLRTVTPPPQPSAEQLAQQQKMMQAARAQQALQQKENHTEDLGTKDFNGVLAHGTRTTRTIPAGEEGNDQPLVVINERWMSREMGLTVMTISDDPRRGRTVTEYEDLMLGEPDPAVFQPPAGYTVQEQPQNGIIGAVMSGVSY